MIRSRRSAGGRPRGLRAQLAAGPDEILARVEADLLDNPHRVAVTLRADPDLTEADGAPAVLARLDPAHREEIIAEHEALQARQAQPDPPAAVARIPVLGRDELPRALARLETGSGRPRAHHSLQRG